MLCVTLVAPFFHLSSYGFYISSKKQNLPIKTLERIRFSSNQNIGEGESNFDEKNVEEMFNGSKVHSEK